MTQQQFVPTDEQQAIIKATKATSNSLMLDAMAGCAKTTSLQLLAPEVRGFGLALAFNKSIAEELRQRFPESFEVRTMNALGFAAMRRALPAVSKWTVETNKIGKLLKEELKARRIKQDIWGDVKGLIQQAQLAGLQPTSDEQQWQDLLGLEVEDDALVVEVARVVLQKSNLLVEQGLISFDDQVYWPVVFEARFGRFGTVLVDEAQDLNWLQHQILQRSIGAKGRLIVCGDPRQSIYGFRGSLSGSMQAIQELRADWQSLPLTLTFRCPKAIVARQQGHAPGYRAAEGNRDGLVVKWNVVDDPEESPCWNWQMLRAAEGQNKAILCRNNAPLMRMTFALIRQGVSIDFAGWDLGQGLASIIKRLCNNDPRGTTAATLLGKLGDEAREAITRHAADDDQRLEALLDRLDCIRAVAEGTGARDGQQVMDHLERLLSPKAGAEVTLSSIHKAKGLEWDVVVHLDPWRIPFKWARKAGGEALRQEWNLKYVCETRTRNVLIEANEEDFR